MKILSPGTKNGSTGAVATLRPSSTVTDLGSKAAIVPGGSI
jgi:hypothetical protein